MLRADRIYGAGLYYEYLTDDARLVIEVMKSAAALGVVIANYAAVDGFVIEDGQVRRGRGARSAHRRRPSPIRGRVVVNAAGPWVDAVRLLSEPGDKPRLRLTKGIHLGVRTDRIGLSHIVVMNARDKRGVFAIPRGAVTYLGTTDTDYPQPDDYPFITHDDVDYLLDAANRTFDVDPPLTPDDVVSAWAGLRPLLHQEGKKPSELSRKDEIMVGASGLLSIAGGKLTTFRRMSERVVDLACERLRQRGVKLPARRGSSEEAILGSGDTGDDVAGFAERLRTPLAARRARRRRPTGARSTAATPSAWSTASPPIRCWPNGSRPRLPVTRAEVEYAAARGDGADAGRLSRAPQPAPALGARQRAGGCGRRRARHGGGARAGTRRACATRWRATAPWWSGSRASTATRPTPRRRKPRMPERDLQRVRADLARALGADARRR